MPADRVLTAGGVANAPWSDVRSAPAGMGLSVAAVKGMLLARGTACQRLYPRLLLVDSTRVGSLSATGQIKQLFLEGWPQNRLLQVYEKGGRLCLQRFAAVPETGEAQALTVEALLEACRDFKPDVIYFRPIDSERLFEFAEQAIDTLGKPLVIQIMDDWPERLRVQNPARYVKLDAVLRRLLALARVRLSICRAMSEAFARRYAQTFLPLANGVDVEALPAKAWGAEQTFSEERPFLLRYMGALADDMTFASITDVAAVVAELAPRLPLRFEVFTMDWCIAKAREALDGMPGVVVLPLVSTEQYPQFLSEADALLIAYNFDAASLRYIGLSMANKLPECLASGAPLLAYGPKAAATIAYLEEAGCAHIVPFRDAGLLREAIERLVADSGYRQMLGQAGRARVRSHHAKQPVIETFLAVHWEAIVQANSTSQVLCGPYARAHAAHYDETDCIAEMFDGYLSGSVMIDVGAHYGSSLKPFVKMGWRVYAFEPDAKNRQQLLERLAKLPNAEQLVKLDTRAVGNESRSQAPYYRSDESTGISGLSAFHASHKSEHTVEVVTLAAALADEPISAVDFLKIDTEGYDLFVLQGFPWERCSPAVIECEYEDAKTVPLGYDFHDLATYLVSKGYSVYVSEWHPVIRYGIRHDWSRLARYPCELSNPASWGNLLAFRDPVDESKLVGTVNELVGLDNTLPIPVQNLFAEVLLDPPSVENPLQFLRVSPNKHFKPLSPTVWHYSHDEKNNHKFWMVIFKPAEDMQGREYTGGIRLQANRAVDMRLTLARHGDKPYEGAYHNFHLTPGVTERIHLSRRFAGEHSELKIQIEIVNLEGCDAVEFTIDSIYVAESLTSIGERITEDQINLQAANRLFREGDYRKAMAIYLRLHKARPFALYADAALLSAHWIGMRSVDCLDELRRRLDSDKKIDRGI